MDVGHVSVEETVREARPTAKTALNAASTPITAPGESTAASDKVSRLQIMKDAPTKRMGHCRHACVGV